MLARSRIKAPFLCVLGFSASWRSVILVTFSRGRCSLFGIQFGEGTRGWCDWRCWRLRGGVEGRRGLEEKKDLEEPLYEIVMRGPV